MQTYFIAQWMERGRWLESAGLGHRENRQLEYAIQARIDNSWSMEGAENFTKRLAAVGFDTRIVQRTEQVVEA